jgi:5'-deoxynucleotidase YfbR-like HD superfamily hydrolase
MAQQKVNREVVRAVVDAGELVLRFGRVERATYHVDGVRPETDTDHTVMLGVIACAFSSKYVPGLDIGKVAQYALIHDLVEAYAGDTPTFGITDGGRREKEKREQEALDRIISEFGSSLPWIPKTIEEYEAQGTPEARFVKFLDKGMPKITHVLNRAAFLRGEGKKREEVERFFMEQHAGLMEKYGDEHPELGALVRGLMDEVLETGEFA